MVKQPMNSNADRLLAIIFFLATFLYFCSQIYPISDFWWHISQGRWIFEHASLPQRDYFSYTPVDSSGFREQVILKGYWLVQLLYYLIYLFSGFNGLVLFQAFLFSLSIWLIYIYFRQRDLPLYSLLLIAPLFIFSSDVVELRPQVVSFLGVVATYLSFEYIRQSPVKMNSSRWVMIIYATYVLFWANSHAGFILVPILGVIYLLDAGFDCYRNRLELNGVFRIGVLVLIATLLTCMNPSGLAAYKSVFFSSDFLSDEIVSFISEYKSVYQYYITTKNEYFAWFALGVSGLYAIILLANFRRQSLRNLLLFVCILFYGLHSFRFFYIYLLLATLVVGSVIPPAVVVNRIRQQKIFAGLFLVLALFSLWKNRLVITEGPLSYNPAGRAITFSINSQLQQPTFNPYDWGGNIMWWSNGRIKTFIDGRVLNHNLYKDYAKTKHGQKAEVFRQYGIKSVMFYLFPPNGMPVPGLIFSLLKDDAWNLVYYDDYSLVFEIKGAEKNRPTFDKKRYSEMIVSHLEGELRLGKSLYKNSVSLAQFYYNLGRSEKAYQMFVYARDLKPDSQFVVQWLNYLGKKDNAPLN